METKKPSSKQIAFAIRRLKVRQATQDEDYNGADVWLNELAVGHRFRDLPISRYTQISIRKRHYTESEYEKILSGKCLAKLWLFEFKDAYILCLTSDIKTCLETLGKAHYQENRGEPNGAYYINLSDIPHLRIQN